MIPWCDESDCQCVLCILCSVAPVPGSFKVHVSSNPEEGSYSHVRAEDVLQTFDWRELRKDVKDMLTKSRVYTLERQYKLIDSPCKAKIISDLERGDPNSATTTLIEYFEANHKGDGMLRFCEFLRDEAEEAGGSAVLEGLADGIERAVKDLGASGTTQHYAIVILISSLSNMNTHTHTHTHTRTHTYYWNIPILYT